MSPSFITGLPRSRTAWFANLLTFNSTIIAHDPLYPPSDKFEFSQSVRRLINALRGGHWNGASDSSLVTIWESIHEAFPESKWVVCKRDMSDVFESCRKIVPDLPLEGIGSLAKELDILIESLNPMVVDFDDITPVTCFKVAEYLGVHIGPAGRVRQLCDFNVQVHPEVLQKRLASLICHPITNTQTK